MMIKINKPTLFLILALTLLGFYLRIDVRAVLMKGDETYTLWALQEYTVLELLTSELHCCQFPGYYFILYPFYLLGGTDRWILAIPQMILSVFSFYLFFLISRQFLKTIVGFGVAFLIFATNANLAYHALEFRPYGTLIVLSMLCFLVTQHIVKTAFDPTVRTKRPSVFIFLTLLYHLYGMFFLVYPYVYHLFSSQKDLWAKTFIKNLKTYGPAILLAFPIWLFFFLQGHNSPQETFQYIGKDAVSLLKGIFGNLMGNNKLYFLLAGFLAFLLPHKNKIQQLFFFLWLVMTPVIMILCIGIIKHYWFIPRLFIWVMPYFAVVLAWMWDSIAEEMIKRFRWNFLKAGV